MKLDIEFQTGLLWQDTQHKEWVELLDALEKSKNVQENQLMFNQAVSFLVMYVNHHFGLEEEYMNKYDYPEKKFHMEEHRLYILRLKDFREKHREFSKEGTSKIIDSMKEWVHSHILENDKKLGQFILQAEADQNKKKSKSS